MMLAGFYHRTVLVWREWKVLVARLHYETAVKIARDAEVELDRARAARGECDLRLILTERKRDRAKCAVERHTRHRVFGL